MGNDKNKAFRNENQCPIDYSTIEAAREHDGNPNLNYGNKDYKPTNATRKAAYEHDGR